MKPPGPDTAAALSQRWARSCAALGSSRPGGIDLTWQVLEALYDHPRRQYHHLGHIAECLETADRFAAAIPAEARPIIDAALIAHDCIYDSRRPDNEARSADIAAMLLREVGAGPAAISAVQRLICATTHRVPPAGDVEAFVCDVDLASLAAHPGEFDANTRAIRAEFAWVEEPAWVAGRAAFFRSMLARDVVFVTPALRLAYEAAARENLSRGLAALGSAPPAHLPTERPHS